ncbi:hypothetical protein NicSoilC5_29240 [Arthrobacter sp. NicSoilC5]|nr:hypothetical protein NicSoilC5_29240 [Arthrobacter sp. NicSoilC5]
MDHHHHAPVLAAGRKIRQEKLAPLAGVLAVLVSMLLHLADTTGARRRVSVTLAHFCPGIRGNSAGFRGPGPENWASAGIAAVSV